MLRRLAANGAKTIIVESPDRFARELAVQLAGHDMLKNLGVSIIPASAPGFFTEDTRREIIRGFVTFFWTGVPNGYAGSPQGPPRKRRPWRSVTLPFEFLKPSHRGSPLRAY